MTTTEIKKMTIKEFIRYIINFDNIDDILDNFKSSSKKGFVFERLFDVVIKFGFCDIFPKSEFKHLIGNTNNLKQLENYEQYVNEKVFNGNSRGCVDIALLNKNDNTYVFITSKYNETPKSIFKYDVQNIIAMSTENNYKCKIYLLVINKNPVLDKKTNAKKSTGYITNNILGIFDKTDLNKYFLAFK
jgi:hypothetical protein